MKKYMLFLFIVISLSTFSRGHGSAAMSGFNGIIARYDSVTEARLMIPSIKENIGILEEIPKEERTSQQNNELKELRKDLYFLNIIK